MAEKNTHYHIYTDEETFNPDILRAVGISKDHVIANDPQQITPDSGNFNPDIDYVDMTPRVKVPSFAEWFGNPNNTAIRTALKAGGATGEHGVNYAYYEATGTLPIHSTSIQNQPVTGEASQPVTTEVSQAVPAKVK